MKTARQEIISSMANAIGFTMYGGDGRPVETGPYPQIDGTTAVTQIIQTSDEESALCLKAAEAALEAYEVRTAHQAAKQNPNPEEVPVADTINTGDPVRGWIAAHFDADAEEHDRLLATLQDAIAESVEDGALLDEADRFLIVGKGGDTEVQVNEPGNTALLKTVTLQPGETLIHVKAKE